MKKLLCVLLSTLILLLAGCASPIMESSNSTTESSSPVEESASLDYEFVTPVRAIQISDVAVEDLDGPTKNINMFITFVNRLDEENTITISQVTLGYEGESSTFPNNAEEEIVLAPQGKVSTCIVYTIPDEVNEFSIDCNINPYEHYCRFRYNL